MLTRWNKKHMLMAEATADTGGGAAGGAGTNSLLGASGSGSGTEAAAGSGDNSQQAAASKAAGATGVSDSGAGNGATDWRSTLPKELQENAGLKKYTSVEALAGAYINATKLIGADKIPLPGKHATDADWRAIQHKLGLPEKIEEYDVKFNDGFNAAKDFVDEFKANAHKAGVLPKQAQAMADWFGALNEKAEKDAVAQRDSEFQAGVARLKADYGASFPKEIARANKVMAEFGGEELVKYFNERGYGGDEKIIRLLAKVGGQLYSEDKVVGDAGAIGGKSPKEVQADIASLRADPAYNDKTHPMHKTAVQDMQELFKLLHPEVDKN